MNDNVVKLKIKPTTKISVTVEVPPETVVLLNKFVALNQHTRNTDGPMSWEKIAQMLLEDVAAAVKDGNSWQGAHMALVLGEHGYRS